ncbi:MAG: TetR/AcrR family transcriptional regulator [candidate division Zixibacteria bacterium]|nr:TetR/AcrR family transcriptional regulator [candidate division Zixibacteria bacterium]
MGIEERRERERRQRRNDIVDAAESVFFSKGYAVATMDDVAEQAELSKGTLYLYFKSKEDLYFAIIFRAHQMLCERFRQAVATQATGLEQVHAIGKAYVQFYYDCKDYYTALVYSEARGMCCEQGAEDNQKIHEMNRPMAILIEALNLGVADGSIRSDINPVETAVILWANTTGLMQVVSKKGNMLHNHFDIQPDDIIKAGFDMIREWLTHGVVDQTDNQSVDKEE